MYSIGYTIGSQGNIMRKLLGKPPAGQAHDAPATAAAPGITSSPLAPHYRPTASQDVVYAAGVPIACLDRSPDGRSAVLAGRHVLRTVSFDGLSVKEGIDLRALLAAQPAAARAGPGAAPAPVADQLSIKAVKWGEPLGRQVLFTACTSGKIFQYDLVRAGSAAPGSPVDCVQMREDSRQVNTLDINPHRNSWLLSGGHDGIVRCFDVRQPAQSRAGATFRSIQAVRCNAEAVRHVQWSPRDGFLFACATEQGVVFKWDMRKPAAPVLRIHAHEKACTAVAWHPDGVHLASAGLDGRCCIWDLSRQDKRQRPKWSIATPAPAAALAWRPGQWSATAQGKRASQLAVSYDDASPRRSAITAVHIWDLARPTMPYREIQRFDSSPSAILWHDQYLLWTAGQDGIFSQCDVSFAPKVIDRQAVSTMAFSPRGDVVMLLDERPPPRRPRPPVSSHHDHASAAAAAAAAAAPAAVPSSYGSSPATPRFSVSRSDSEDDAIGTFIGPRRRGSQRRRPSTRSVLPSLSTTPPAGPAMDEVMSLEQTIKATGTYRPQQAMAVGRVPAAASVDVYEYLTANYLEALHERLPFAPGGPPLPDRIAAILEHYAAAAVNVRQFRLAQTWRILAYAVDLLLHKRAQYHLERRMDRHQNLARRKSEAKARAQAKAIEGLLSRPVEEEPAVRGGEETPRRVASTASVDKALHHPRSLLSSGELDSSSNAPTPLARPMPDESAIMLPDESGRGRPPAPVFEPGSFTLPPPAQPPPPDRRERLDSVPLSITSTESAATHASTEGYDFYDAEAIRKAIDPPAWKAAPTRVLDFGRSGSPSRVPRPTPRQDSDEGYVHLFSLSDEGRRATGLAHFSDGVLPPQAAQPAVLAAPRDSTGPNDFVDEGSLRARRQQSATLSSDPDPNNPVVPIRRLLERTETDLTTFTDEHHAITQTTTDSVESPFPSQTDADFSLETPPRQDSLADATESPENDKSPFIVETDYLCWPDDLPYPYPADPASSAASAAAASSPLQPYSLISRALAFEAKSSALNASAMILLLKPLLPEDVIDPFQAAAILRQHHSRLMAMKLFVEAALLRKLCLKGWPGGPLSAWGDNYPAIFTPAQQGVQANFFCTACHKPRDLDRTSRSTDSIWHCERCDAVMAPCAVCGLRDTAPDLSPPPPSSSSSSPSTQQTDHPVLTTWWFCPGCGHGGHSSCLRAWHAALEPDSPWAAAGALDDPPAISSASTAAGAAGAAAAADSTDGCCPLDGCGHVCLPPARWRADADDVSRVVREATRAVAKGLVAAAEAAAVGAPHASLGGGGGGTAAAGSGGTAAGGGEGVAAAGAAGAAGGGEEEYHGEGWAGNVHYNNGARYHGGGGGAGAGAAVVRSDGFDVPQSRAVETVRETLAAGGWSGGSGGGGGGRVGTGILSSSPGRGGLSSERERRKSVKFVATEERR